MELLEALNVGMGEVVALVGAGGKTTAMFHLAEEGRRRGWRVLVTTTTKIFPPTKNQSPVVILASTLDHALREAINLKPAGTATIAQKLLTEGKLQGVPGYWIAEIKQAADLVLVEADGAAGRSFKAPAEHEPVIPAAATLVVAIAGVDIVGKPLSREFVHRPERAAILSGLSLHSPVTEEGVTLVLLHPQGCLRGKPPQARVAIVLNKVDGPKEEEVARSLANHLIACGAPLVVLTHLLGDPPVVDVISPTNFPEADMSCLQRSL